MHNQATFTRQQLRKGKILTLPNQVGVGPAEEENRNRMPWIKLSQQLCKQAQNGGAYRLQLPICYLHLVYLFAGLDTLLLLLCLRRL